MRPDSSIHWSAYPALLVAVAFASGVVMSAFIGAGGTLPWSGGAGAGFALFIGMQWWDHRRLREQERGDRCLYRERPRDEGLRPHTDRRESARIGLGRDHRLRFWIFLSRSRAARCKVYTARVVGGVSSRAVIEIQRKPLFRQNQPRGSQFEGSEGKGQRLENHVVER